MTKYPQATFNKSCWNRQRVCATPSAPTPPADFIDSGMRCSASFLDPLATDTSRCLVGSDRRGNLMIFDTLTGITHMERSAAPKRTQADKDELYEAVRARGLSPEEAVEFLLDRARASLARAERRRFDKERGAMTAKILASLRADRAIQ